MARERYLGEEIGHWEEYVQSLSDETYESYLASLRRIARRGKKVSLRRKVREMRNVEEKG